MSLAELRAGGKAALAAALTHIETGALDTAMLDAAYGAPRGAVLGVTGPPGVGKSTLIAALIRRWRAAGETVAVLAVDPSSRATRGALLGDRVRMRSDPADAGVFIRSFAAGAALGGLAPAIYPAVVLMRAAFDRVLVETVGVGQSETAVTGVADSVVLCLQPGSGDALQYMKAGIMEIPDIVVVTKADMPSAARTLSDAAGALTMSVTDGWTPVALAVAATLGTGLGALDDALARRAAWLTGPRLAGQRASQAAAWIATAVVTEIARQGHELIAATPQPAPAMPFGAVAAQLRQLRVTRG